MHPQVAAMCPCRMSGAEPGKNAAGEGDGVLLLKAKGFE